jgi:endonuclease/exonuclease/phosphatase family metal-dependent hydrolase
MKKQHLLIIVFAILLLFLVQSAGSLVESIYILDLMNSSLDAKVLGVLFFFVPLLVLPFYKKFARPLMWVLFSLLFICRGVIPYLSTSNRMIVSGVATAVGFSLLFLLVTSLPGAARRASAGLALAVATSVLLRTAGHGIDYSLTSAGSWVGWLLGVLFGVSLFIYGTQRELTYPSYGGNPTLPVLGIYLVLTLVYFSVSAPAVIARWTEGNYTLIVALVSLLALTWAGIAINRPGLIDRISPGILITWNLLFTLSLTLTLLVNRVSFPATLDSPAVVVGAPTVWQQLPLAFMLVFFPVLFLDLEVFIQKMGSSTQARRSLALGMFLGSFALVLLIFINIFTNVWGYIEPVSPPFRNTYWLSYFLLSGGITLIAWGLRRVKTQPGGEPVSRYSWVWSALLTATFIITLVLALPTQHAKADAGGKTTLRLMTFNTQQSNDESGEKSYAAQLALMRQIAPDIIALQETDSTRISLNNNDYVRYFADNLGYYSYFGPKTVAGSYGTAILSRYPLANTRTAFMFSDKDETGVAEAEVAVGGKTFTIYDVHPDSSDPAMVAFAHTLIERSQDKPYVIAMGDYNLRDYEEAYKIIDAVYTNAWTSVYPTEISSDGVDMSGENRIDHIFLSPNLEPVNPTYILPPESATDHPVHWTDIVWTEP